MQLHFFGASGSVTGSCYLLTSDENLKILIDFGMFQGKDVEHLNHEALQFAPKDLSAVLITHAHLDHCGRLPLLVKNGFKGKIYMTSQTEQLVSLALFDAVKVANERRNSFPPLYSEEDVQKTLQIIETIAYGNALRLNQANITFQNAGHILGSSSIEISIGEKKIVFSGDIGNPNQKLLQPAHSLFNADIVIMESTYGDRIHPDNDIDLIGQEINKIEKSNGVLLIPAFALDRTQVILHVINHLKKDAKIKSTTPVFLDSPMGIKATLIYKTAKENWSEELKSHTDDPFSFPGLTMTEDAIDSENILKVKGPKIIIAGNGMMTGGRIWHHLINYLPIASTRVLIVGFQGEGTLGREILSGARQVNIYHETVQLQATVTEIKGLSAHADQNELLDWLKQFKDIKQLFITHGEEDSRKKLAEKIQHEFSFKDIIPEMGDIFTLE